MSVRVDPKEARNPVQAGIWAGDKVGYVSGDGAPWWALGDQYTAFANQAAILEPDEQNDVYLAAAKLGLNFEVGLAPMYYEYNGALSPDSSRKVIRLDTGEAFTTVGAAYQVIQNEVGLNFTHDLSLDGDNRVRTMGTLRNGRQCFTLIAMPDLMVVNEMHFPYILTTWGHDGITMLTSGPVVERAVCGNTVRLGISQMGRFKVQVKHWGDVSRRADEARRILAVSLNLVTAYKDKAERLATVKATVGDFDAFMDWLGSVSPVFDVTPSRDDEPLATIILPPELAGIPVSSTMQPEIRDFQRVSRRVKQATENREKLAAIWNEERDRSPTYYGLAQSITGFVDHEWRYNKSQNDEKERRFSNILLEKGADLKENAHNWLEKRAFAA